MSQSHQKDLRALIPKRGGSLFAMHTAYMNVGPKGVIKPGICTLCNKSLTVSETIDAYELYCYGCTPAVEIKKS